MHMRVGCDIDVAKIVFDLFEYFAFTISKSFCDVRMNPEGSVPYVVELL